MGLVGVLSGFTSVLIFLGKVVIAGVYIYIYIIYYIDVLVLPMVGLL